MPTDEPSNGESLSPIQMRAWFEEEARNVTKAFQLRVAEATGFVMPFLTGQIGAEEAAERLRNYERTWDSPFQAASFTRRARHAFEQRSATAPTPEEMAYWYRNEIRDVTMETQMRLQEASDFTTARMAGHMSGEEVAERCYRYSDRWDDALFGASAVSSRTDDEIRATIARARQEMRNLRSDKGFQR